MKRADTERSRKGVVAFFYRAGRSGVWSFGACNCVIKFILFLVELITRASLAFSIDKVPDLTQKSAEVFKAQLGNTVTLRGRLEVGMQGYSLFGATTSKLIRTNFLNPWPHGFLIPVPCLGSLA